MADANRSKLFFKNKLSPCFMLIFSVSAALRCNIFKPKKVIINHKAFADITFILNLSFKIWIKNRYIYLKTTLKCINFTLKKERITLGYIKPGNINKNNLFTVYTPL